jgi:hypothetical protein
VVLKYHFGLSPKALADAADDYAKSRFLALSDLLAIPRPNLTTEGGVSAWIQNDGQVYRLCFQNDSVLFSRVNVALGRSAAK